ncbi:hypothetical protein Ancab_011354 [Ancistrocladus abbreviatus]
MLEIAYSMEVKTSENLSKKQLLHPKSTEEVLHVLLFPFPAQGHIIPFLKLAELLCLAGLKVTFLVIEQIHPYLVQNPDIKSRFARFPGFHLESISNGRSPTDPPPKLHQMGEEWHLLSTKARPLLEKMLVSDYDHRPKFSCLIPDGIMGFPIDMANELQIPVITFHVLSAITISYSFSIRELIAIGKFPFAGDANEITDCIKGVEGVFRVKDLRGEPLNGEESMAWAMTRTKKAQGTIVNSFEDLEGPILSQIRCRCPNTFAIGPLHKHIKCRLSQAYSTEEVANTSWSIWAEDKSCMAWLDAQPFKSVIYVSFGSISLLNEDEFLELWHGLVESGNRFLWVLRPDLVTGANWGDQLPSELVEEAKGRACVVQWAPQEDVLTHPAIGSFMTQLGWNSTLETIAAGVPVIGWPCLTDQHLNGRYFTETFKIGLVLKDYAIDRHTVARMVNEVMEKKKDEYTTAASLMAILANKAVNEGGSSYNDFKSLVDHIRLIGLKVPA